ncbi:precorrin-3B synthase [Stenomitos frigidus ULC18]|uniref:Precorrin-3B synthase n=1 Tax=Stenomitos frigidus ULC18 TaxID=2107698 RepID=A0A2T1DZH5_9CYAN|nr:precorrin-3B synthase [Stenomitos frigidus ULC18]
MEVLSLECVSSQFAICPGLFQPSAANDGLLSRLRVPGGLLTVTQCEAIADLADQLGGGYVEVTNRANVQIRGLQSTIDADHLARLQAVGLASPVAAIDALRNIMCSPTAGIDRQQLLDTRPFVAAWNRYLTTRPDFAVLSPKFSVCFDGGEAVSVRDRPNDISLVAVAITDAIYFRLHLSLGDRGASPCDTGVVIQPEESLQLLIAMTEVYRDYTMQKLGNSSQRKPRLRNLLHDWGLATYLQAVVQRLSFLPLRDGTKSLRQNEKIDGNSFSDAYNHLGIHSQRQSDRSYIGCILPLGRLETIQLRGLATLASQYGSSMLRLTPWQNVLLSDLPTAQIAVVQQKIEQLGLHSSATHPHGAIVACSGTTGCQSSATNTQADALALAAHLEQTIVLSYPVNIHFSGCEKSCAQHHASDIALLGVAQEGEASYHVYVGDDGSKFGRSLYQNYRPAHLPALIEQMLRVYQEQSQSHETFKSFVNRYKIAELKQMLIASDRHLIGARQQN